MNELFTNLMLVKGYTKMSQLSQAARQKDRALQIEPERRSAEQEETIRAHFVSITPLLTDARAELEEAQAASERFQASVWETHGRMLADRTDQR